MTIKQNESNRNQIVELVLESSFTNQSVRSSKSIIDIIGRLGAVDMIAYDNLEGLIAQRCIVAWVVPDRNGYNVVVYGRILGKYNHRINRGTDSVSYNF